MAAMGVKKTQRGGVTSEVYCNVEEVSEEQRGPLLLSLLKRAAYEDNDKAEVMMTSDFIAKLLGVSVVQEVVDKGAMYLVLDEAALQKETSLDTTAFLDAMNSSPHQPCPTDGY